MKKIAMCIAAAICALSMQAKETPLSLAFGLAESADNLGINLEITSPSFARDFLVLRIESQLDLLSAYRNDPDLSWEQFSSHRLGVAGTGGWNSDTVRLYGEFGGLAVLPPEKLTDDAAQFGIYGLFGFEFFIDSDSASAPMLSYYLEAGTNSIFDEAERIPGSPDYYSGFTVKTGLRWYP